MSRISQLQDNFLEGISQQPDVMRSRNQLAEQINALSSPARGLCKRPPFKALSFKNSDNQSVPIEYKDKIFDETISGHPESFTVVKSFFVDRSPLKKYLVVLGRRVSNMTDQAVIKTFNLINGTVKEDVFGNYLLVGSNGTLASYVMTDKLKVFSYLDTTFLINPEKIPSTVYATNASFPACGGNLNKLFVTIKGGKYGHTYKIIINGVEIATRTTPNGSTTDDAPYIATDSIAQMLYANFYERNGNSDTVVVSGTTIRGSYTNNKGRSYIMFDLTTNGTEPTIEVNDGFGGENIAYVYNGYVKRKEDIPDIGNNHGDLMFKVIGNTESGADDMYVRFENGYWKESTTSAVSFKNLPCRLIISDNGTPSLDWFNWVSREVGDDVSNPVPSFINKSLKDICLFRNRLAFLTEDTICLSQSGDMFNFWRGTTSDVLDSDPIDLNVMSEDSTELNFMTALQDNLILISDKNQFILTSTSGALTPKTTRVTEVSKYSNDSSFLKPITLGRKLYFTNNREGFSQLNEYYDMGEAAAVFDKITLTQHVSAFIKNPGCMAGSETENMICIAAQNEPKLYIYKYLFGVNGERIQSAWSLFSYPIPYNAAGSLLVKDILFSDSMLFVTYRYSKVDPAGGLIYHTEVISTDFSESAGYIDGVPFRPYYDFIQMVDLSLPVPDSNRPRMYYHERTGYTYISLDDYYLGNDLLQTGSVCYINGTVIQPMVLEAPSTEVIGVVHGIVPSDAMAFIGIPIPFSVTMSNLMIKRPDGMGGIKPVTNGRFTIQDLTVNVADSGEFFIVVDTGRKSKTFNKFNPRVLGDMNRRMADVPVHTGPFKVSVRAPAKDTVVTINSRSIYPLSLLSAEWTGIYLERGI